MIFVESVSVIVPLSYGGKILKIFYKRHMNAFRNACCFIVQVITIKSFEDSMQNDH